ncbi:unnamed protein product [Cladocopium goreaui]|uniref:ATP-dependent DNA helicase n=1 Tax=Cladocopium goreaui TaxID=2562237 RepID=A0A9P1G2D2_9DINO|nr:unnamed protein product [Cladocopium goreaui]
MFLEPCGLLTHPVLASLNRDVDRENAARLSQLPGSARILRSQDRIPKRASAAQRASLDRKVPERLSLKVGAQVIHLCNDPAMGLVNGHRGRVEAFEGGKPVVRFDNGKRICIGVHKFTQGQGSKSLERYQVPLKLGWALTVHKAQGMTLTRAELQLDNVFEVGQSYVALSRLTGTEGLWIRGALNLESSCRAHPEVLRYYQDAKQRSLAACQSTPAMKPIEPKPVKPVTSASKCSGKAERCMVEPVEAAGRVVASPGPHGKRPRPAATLLERLSKRHCKENAKESSKLLEAKKSESQHTDKWVTPLHCKENAKESSKLLEAKKSESQHTDKWVTPLHCKENAKESSKLLEAKKSESQHTDKWVTPLKHWCDPIEID